MINLPFFYYSILNFPTLSWHNSSCWVGCLLCLASLLLLPLLGSLVLGLFLVSSLLLLFAVLLLLFLLVFLFRWAVLLALMSWCVLFVLAFVFSRLGLLVSLVAVRLRLGRLLASGRLPFLVACGFPFRLVLVLLAWLLLRQPVVAFLVLAPVRGLLLLLLLVSALLAWSSFLLVLLLLLAGASLLVAAAGSSVRLLSSLLSCPCSSCCPASAGLFSR